MNSLELRDIHLPDASLWWPPAPGWWLLLILIIAAFLLLPWWLRRRQRKPLRSSSLSQLKRINIDYRSGLSARAALERIGVLLRRILISYRGRDGYAASTGEAWLAQIESLPSSKIFSRSQLELLAFARYRADVDCDIKAMLGACERWIKALPRGRHVSD